MTDLISRADAIEAIQNAYCKPCKERGDDHNEVRCRACAFDDAIIQIDDLSSAELPRGDLILRADAIDAIDDVIDADSPQWAILRTKVGFLPSAEAVPIHEDGTLEVKVPNAYKVGRVLVMDTDSHIGGGLFYPDDTVYGEWQRVDEQPYFRKHYHKVCCSVCHKQGNEKYNYCPNCGARMKGGAE